MREIFLCKSFVVRTGEKQQGFNGCVCRQKKAPERGERNVHVHCVGVRYALWPITPKSNQTKVDLNKNHLIFKMPSVAQEYILRPI